MKGVLASPRLNSTLLRDLSGLKRSVSAITTPDSMAQLVKELKKARRSNACVYPVSCGRNWGFGSNLPTEDHSILLNLCRMATIRHLDLDAGYAEIEPGVTQGQLHDALTRRGRSHYFNITGAGTQVSVIGNALERGIGYFGPREEDLLDLEVVLCDGQRFWTSEVPNNPFHTGLGLGLKNLFYQSNLGVVTAAKVKLYKRPECMAAWTVEIPDDESGPVFMEALRSLRQEGIIRGVPHVGNHRRMFTTLAPECPPGSRQQLANSLPNWFCLASSTGTCRGVEADFQYVQSKLQPFGSCSLISSDLGPVDPRYAGLAQLAQGIPSDLALGSISFAALGVCQLLEITTLDSGRAGLIHVTPTCAASSFEVARLLQLIKSCCQDAEKTELPITLNLVNAGMVAAIVSIPFDRSCDKSSSKARLLSKRILTRCFKNGFAPYRLGLEDSRHKSTRVRSAKAKIKTKIQELFDPTHMLSSSKYELFWNTHAAKAISNSRFRIRDLEGKKL